MYKLDVFDHCLEPADVVALSKHYAALMKTNVLWYTGGLVEGEAERMKEAVTSKMDNVVIEFVDSIAQLRKKCEEGKDLVKCVVLTVGCLYGLGFSWDSLFACLT